MSRLQWSSSTVLRSLLSVSPVQSLPLKKLQFPLSFNPILLIPGWNQNAILRTALYCTDQKRTLERDVNKDLKTNNKILKEFDSVFPHLVERLSRIDEYKDMAETNDWLARVLYYNVPHGKKQRGMITALTYRHLSQELNDETVKLSYVLGWLVEMLQAHLLVVDDIMDASETRRGQPCWYKLDNIGYSGFNDGALIQTSIYMLLKYYFGQKPYYIDLVDILHEANHQTLYGQNLDTRTGIEKKLETYTMERYTAIVKYKTSIYSFFLPVRLGMVMAGLNKAEVVEDVRQVTLQLGHYFQVQDDFLDCFGDPGVTGKVGTDIQEGKCSWLFVKANEKCTTGQRDVLFNNYGKRETSCVKLVKELYSDLQLPEAYKLYEEETYKLICDNIYNMHKELPKELLLNIVNRIYKRSK